MRGWIAWCVDGAPRTCPLQGQAPARGDGRPARSPRPRSCHPRPAKRAIRAVHSLCRLMCSSDLGPAPSGRHARARSLVCIPERRTRPGRDAPPRSRSSTHLSVLSPIAVRIDLAKGAGIWRAADPRTGLQHGPERCVPPEARGICLYRSARGALHHRGLSCASLSGPGTRKRTSVQVCRRLVACEVGSRGIARTPTCAQTVWSRRLVRRAP